MSDYSLPPCVTLVPGRSGSGKTTFCFRYLVNALTEQPANANPAACVFIFDWKGEAARRLDVKPCNTAAQCVAALSSRLVVFNPHPMFPGDSPVKNPEGETVPNDAKMALRWFAKWAFEISARGAGKKIFYCDEMKNFTGRWSVFPEISRVANAGRAENLELLLSSHRPADWHDDLRVNATEWVCFSANSASDLAAARQYFPNVDKVTTLPLGSFIAYNRESGAELAGKLF